MSRPSLALAAAVVLALGAAVVSHERGAHVRAVAMGGASLDPSLDGQATERHDGADAPTGLGRSPEDTSGLLGASAEGTYLDDVVIDRGYALARWRERIDNPIRVWVQDRPPLEGWSPVFGDAAAGAFDEWESTAVPVRFVFVADSDAAEIQLRWIDHFEAPINGETAWTRDRDWWIIHADINIGIRSSTGDVLSDAAIHALALHEIGHALGLDHTEVSPSIMTARIRSPGLADIDTATIRLLYSLRPGPTR